MQQCYRRGPALRRCRHWHAGLLPRRLPRPLCRPEGVPAPPRDAHRRHAPQGDRRARDRAGRSEEHTSELQSYSDLVCRLLLEKKKKTKAKDITNKKKKNNKQPQ